MHKHMNEVPFQAIPFQAVPYRAVEAETTPLEMHSLWLYRIR